jgi:hypothetical protein
MNNMFPTEITLKQGSHRLPSEGSCAMEVAILAAGYGWKQVKDISDLPECMSHVIGGYVISLNDSMPDDIRQKLMPFVTRMSGTKASLEIENKRALYLTINAGKHKLKTLLGFYGFDKFHRKIDKCDNALDLCLLSIKIEDDETFTKEFDLPYVRSTLSFIRNYLAHASLSEPEYSTLGAGNLYKLSRIVGRRNFDWGYYIQLLDDVLKIGPQSDPVEVELIKERTKILVNA